MLKNKSFFILLTILIFGFVIRLVGLSLYPPGLNWDEVSLGYNAYSLLQSGHDEWGKYFPVIFQAYGDYKLPLYVYSAVPTIALFGLNPLGVRLPSVIAGTLLILLSYLLAKRIFNRSGISLITALLVATQPWTVFLSRIAVEANLAVLYITLGFYLSLKRRFVLGALFLGLSAWTYNSARFLVPAVILLTVIYYFRQLKNYLLPLGISAIFIIPMLIQMLNPSGQARLGWLTILDSGAIAKIESQRATSTFAYPRLLHNKLTYFTTNFVKNYISYYSPDFLFVSGGSHYQFNIPGLGLLAFVCLPFFYLGVIFLLISKKPETKLVLVWLLLAPIAGSITRDSPHTLRAITLLPLPMIITAFGLIKVTDKISILKIPAICIFVVSILFSFWRYSYTYTYSYVRDYSWAWQYGHEQAIKYVSSRYQDYNRIIFTKKYGEPHEFVLFYNSWDPDTYLSDPHLVRYYKSNWYWVDSFAKYVFVNDWEMPDYINSLSDPGRYLIVSSPEHPVASEKIHQINFLDQQPAFIISYKIL